MSESSPNLPAILDFQTGELIDAGDAPAVAKYLSDLRTLKMGPLQDAIRACEEALIAEATRQGTKTLHLGTADVEISESKTIEWDLDKLEELRDAGLPEERYNELVKATVTYKVSASEANRLSSANPAYAEIISAARTDLEGTKRVKVKT